MNEQITMADVDAIFSLMESTTKNGSAKQDSVAARELKQKNKVIAHDVGNKIGGARKDLAKKRKLFLSKPSADLLKEIEEADTLLAAELLDKKNFFTWFSLLKAKDAGIEVSAAKGLELVIRRLPKNSEGMDHIHYFNALQYISEELKRITTYEEFKRTIWRLSFMLRQQKFIALNESHIDAYEKEINNAWKTDPEQIKEFKERIGELKCNCLIGDISSEWHLEQLGKFTELLDKAKNRRYLYNKVMYLQDWNEVVIAKSGTASNGERKRIWTRELPKVAQRSSQDGLQTIQTPEEFRSLFNFRSIEFGNYVDDKKGLEHLVNASYAFQDLAAILDIPLKGLSLDGKLAMAFGSRGRGHALAHYERNYHVINMTKERGVLGVLAHEWFHSFDRFLYNVYVDENGMNMLSEKNTDQSIPATVTEKLDLLIQAMTVGTSTAYQDMGKRKRFYHISSNFKDTYSAAEGDLLECMDSFISSIDYKLNREFKNYSYFISSPDDYKKTVEKFKKKRKRLIREYAEALSQYHEDVTGSKVDSIPYPSKDSEYLTKAIVCDRGNRGKYWSNIVELSARAFEAFILDELKARNWINDYLVCGITGIYPEGEERIQINAAMREFLTETLSMLKK